MSANQTGATCEQRFYQKDNWEGKMEPQEQKDRGETLLSKGMAGEEAGRDSAEIETQFIKTQCIKRCNSSREFRVREPSN